MPFQEGKILPWISKTNDDDGLGIELRATYGLSCCTAKEKETENIHLLDLPLKFPPRLNSRI
jgi:hypothetical protein